MDPKEKAILSRLEDLISSQDFSDWYIGGRFQDYLKGRGSREDILLDLHEMLTRRGFFEYLTTAH